jgi:BirA family biotin operon repressor/biotin-[acetyl-CoA-carboxylase] ligase
MCFDLSFIKQARPDTQVFYYQSVASTMTEAARLVHEGACAGTVVLAEEQTAGQGRLGRGWISEAGVGIYCSIILGLQLPPARFPIVSLLLGLATAAALERAANVKCDLRWPNDVLIEDRKVAGILPQLVDSWVVAGIGINVNNTQFPPGLRTLPISLKIARGGKDVPREKVLLELLNSIDEMTKLLEENGPDAILRAFTHASSYVSNRRVLIEDTGAVGVTAGLDENGFLLVRTNGGRLNRIAAGGIRPVAR